MKIFCKKILDYIKKSFKNFCDREYKYYSLKNIFPSIESKIQKSFENFCTSQYEFYNKLFNYHHNDYLYYNDEEDDENQNK